MVCAADGAAAQSARLGAPRRIAIQVAVRPAWPRISHGCPEMLGSQHGAGINAALQCRVAVLPTGIRASRAASRRLHSWSRAAAPSPGRCPRPRLDARRRRARSGIATAATPGVGALAGGLSTLRGVAPLGPPDTPAAGSSRGSVQVRGGAARVACVIWGSGETAQSIVPTHLIPVFLAARFPAHHGGPSGAPRRPLIGTRWPPIPCRCRRPFEGQPRLG